MGKFVTMWFATIFGLVALINLNISTTTAAIVAAGMMIGIFPMLTIHDWIVEMVEKYHRNQHTRQRVGIYPYDDWK